jgi:Short C-terminal domain
MTDELERLHALHRAGALTATEFERAKTRLLNDPPPAGDDARMRRLELEAELARVDREFELVRSQCLMATRHGQSCEPERSHPVLEGLLLFLLIPALMAVGTFAMFPVSRYAACAIPALGIMLILLIRPVFSDQRRKWERLEAARSQWQEARGAILERLGR